MFAFDDEGLIVVVEGLLGRTQPLQGTLSENPGHVREAGSFRRNTVIQGGDPVLRIAGGEE